LWINETLGAQVLDRWELWRPTIEALNRGKTPDAQDRVYRNFELLNKRLRGEKLRFRQKLSRWIIRQLPY
jgi:hypothetical protein